MNATHEQPQLVQAPDALRARQHPESPAARPKRGEIWMADVFGQAGPVLVLSVEAEGGEHAVRTCLRRITDLRRTKYEVLHDSVHGLPHGAFDTQSLITVPVAMLERRMGNLSMEKMCEVDEAVRMWLGL